MKSAQIEAVIREVLTHETVDLGWRMPAPLPVAPTVVRVSDFVDHTLLRAEARGAEIDTLCKEAAEHRFAAVCVNGNRVRQCARLLNGTGVKVATVVGFPLGAMATEAKATETRIAIGDGADEIDMVVSLGQILDEDWNYVEDDVTAVVEAAQGRVVKVILETAVLEPTLLIKSAAISKACGASFVKTSSGFHPAGGATLQAVTLMKLAVGDALGVKAAGGIRDCETALRMIAAGASRIGTSAGVQFTHCLQQQATSLSELLSNPAKHAHVCSNPLEATC